MAKGGARARSGPAPDPEALRRERDARDWVVLPAEGRKGSPPRWPLPDSTRREAELWKVLWAKPQAVMWERQGQELEVALYVRRWCEAEVAESRVTLSTLVRQMADSLGLTTPGLRANRWRIAPADDQPSSRRRQAVAIGQGRRHPSARQRLEVIDGGAAS